jgi:SAM-dependent methyltransferase
MRLRGAGDSSSARVALSAGGKLGDMTGPWNANIHHDGRLDACVPASARSVLEVGCGDGFLAARLARRVPLVVAVDIDAPVLEQAPARFPGAKVTWCHGDVLSHPLRRQPFDAVVSNATLHHLPDTRAALRRLSQLVRPGGTLAIAGFTRTEWRDWPWAMTAFVCLGVANRVEVSGSTPRPRYGRHQIRSPDPRREVLAIASDRRRRRRPGRALYPGRWSLSSLAQASLWWQRERRGPP